jgi:hypothetical protein
VSVREECTDTVTAETELEKNKMKKILVIAGAVILCVLVAAGSFYGGMAYQSSKANQAQSNFMAARGGTNNGQMPDPSQMGSGRMNNGQAPQGAEQGGFGGGTMGEVKTIDGNVMTISTAQDVTTINLSDLTRISKAVDGTVSDLQPGMRVRVSGDKDSSGSISASLIQIVSSDAAAMPQPPAAGTAP